MNKAFKSMILTSLFLILFGLLLLWFGGPSLWQESYPSPTPLVDNAPVTTTAATFGLEGEQVLVLEVIDGDTIKIEGGITVRLLGIDTPETKDPRKPVGCFGKEASLKTKSLLSGKVTILQKDVSDKDKYGRLLRYVFLPLEEGDALFINDYLIREGFAKVLTIPPDVKFTDQFLEAQKEARETKKGLWAKCI